MCYSAMVEQDVKAIGRKFGARVQLDMYDDLFTRRLKGEKILLNKALEYQFIKNSELDIEVNIASNIRQWHETQIPEIEKEIFKQTKRLADAKRILDVRITKKADNDFRIATSKIEKLKNDLRRHRSEEIESESDLRIFPYHYMSMLSCNEKNEIVVIPVRYLLRPSDKEEDFDFKFNGCYNARLDSLDRVAWWKKLFGRRHGLILVKKFYENVSVENYSKKNTLDLGFAEKQNIVLCFEPDNVEYMFVPTLWDIWERKGRSKLFSAALITDEPAPEVVQAGHDRTPIFLKQDAVRSWLTAKGKSVQELKAILANREYPRYCHKIVGTA